jgi:hypothetical protein
MSSSLSNNVLKMDCEPELSEIPSVDKGMVRNILYATWALQETDNTCTSWNVQNKSWGYLINISFGDKFSISLNDIQLIKDMNPLRIEHVMLRNSDVAALDGVAIGFVLVVKLLNQNHPVSITETEIVRVRKRHRGWFGSE